MAQTKHEIQALLADAGTGPRHRFGQNFMIDQNLVRLVAEAGRIAPGDVVVEVGPGTGTLTEELLDLDATTKGYGGALYAATDPGGSCCSGCCNLVLCCCCSQICW